MSVKKHIKSIPARLANKLSPLELETAKEVSSVDKYDIGLNEVDNTSDEDKPISTATQVALDQKEYVLTAGDNITIDRTNPLAPTINGIENDAYAIGIILG
jgi:hypothetical protein